MKKIQLLIPLFIGLVAVSAHPAFARSSEEPVNVEEVNETNEDVGYFPGCDDDEKVIPLGGWLSRWRSLLTKWEWRDLLE